MRSGRLLVLAFVGAATLGFSMHAAWAAPPETVPPTAPAKPGAPQAAPAKPSSLDELFTRLAASGEDEEASGIAKLIERRFARSGSDTADLLMSRAGEALVGEDGALAVELLDRVTQIRPEWAEAWNRRAVAFYRLDDPVRAIQDLEECLVHEPRHFSAWVALGHMQMAQGDKKLALAAYRRALAIYPLMKEARTMVDRLVVDVDGQEL